MPSLVTINSWCMLQYSQTRKLQFLWKYIIFLAFWYVFRLNTFKWKIPLVLTCVTRHFGAQKLISGTANGPPCTPKRCSQAVLIDSHQQKGTCAQAELTEVYNTNRCCEYCLGTNQQAPGFQEQHICRVIFSYFNVPRSKQSNFHWGINHIYL